MKKILKDYPLSISVIVMAIISVVTEIIIALHIKNKLFIIVIIITILSMIVAIDFVFRLDRKGSNLRR